MRKLRTLSRKLTNDDDGRIYEKIPENVLLTVLWQLLAQKYVTHLESWKSCWDRHFKHLVVISFAEAYSEPCQVYKMEPFAKIVKGWIAFTIFCTNLHLRCLTRFCIRPFWISATDIGGKKQSMFHNHGGLNLNPSKILKIIVHDIKIFENPCLIELFCSDNPACACFPLFVLNEFLLAIIYPSICLFFENLIKYLCVVTS